MKQWLKKIKSSLALDSARQEARGANEFEVLERRLGTDNEGIKNEPPNLHNGIMRAVRQAERERASAMIAEHSYWRVGTGLAAMALLVVAGSWWFAGREAPANSAPGAMAQLATVATALERSQTISREVPNAAFAPLAEELAQVNQDIEKAVTLLVASLP